MSNSAVSRWFPIRLLTTAGALLSAACLPALSAEAPRIVHNNGRSALLVDGKPFLILGGQIHNSSAWPSELPRVWNSMADLHANTIEAPIYWEQFESQPGKFDFTNIDAIVKGARAHDLRVVLLWFGTWKNGNMHYAPSWVKTNVARFPRVIRKDGEPIDVLSPMSRNTLEADKAAFVELMRHLRQIDGERHTVILIQVENESGNIGSVRDYSAASNQKFAGPVPADLLNAAGKQSGTWSDVFGADADEIFQAYHQAKYINEIAEAGKREFAIPCYMNVWLDYPPQQLAQRQMDQPGIGYPSGGAVRKLVGLWRALAPAIDAVAPDIYSDDSGFVRDVIKAYNRPDNPLLIPEIARTNSFGKWLFYALGEGTLGFAPFGVDDSGWNIIASESWTAHKQNFAVIAPMAQQIAELEFAGKVKATVEEPGEVSQELDFGGWQATVAYGFPQYDGVRAPGTKDAHGAALVAQLGPDEFLVTGVDASVIFHLSGKKPWMHSQFLSVEEGTFNDGVWKPARLWNGDETDRGLMFHNKPQVVRVKMQLF
jgi:hypothetical protein